MTYASKLFGVFQRLHSRRGFEGTGTGLATGHRVISSSWRAIWADETGRGATFSFTLEYKFGYPSIAGGRDRTFRQLTQ
jgi:light-regulated signal transduction histidine kinase (bacteriophytochrome)